MERDYEREIEELRSEISRLNKLLEREKGMSAGDRASEQHAKLRRAEELAEIAGQKGISGAITYYGAYNSSGRGFRWETECMSTDTLLSLDEDKVAMVLSALGNNQRYAILKEILKQPLSVNEIIEKLDLGTTGQVYHHIRPLQAADFISRGKKGKYEFKPHRVQALLMILTGVFDVLDEQYPKER